MLWITWDLLFPQCGSWDGIFPLNLCTGLYVVSGQLRLFLAYLSAFA